MKQSLRVFLAYFCATITLFATHYNCTTTVAGNLTTTTWTNCNGTYPHNNGADTYSAHITGVNVAMDASVELGKSPSGYEVAFTNATDKLSCTGCTYANNDRVRLIPRSVFDNLTVGTNWPIGLGVNDYYIVNWVSASDFQLSTTAGGAAALFTSDGAVGIKIQEYTPAVSQSGNSTWTINTGVTPVIKGDWRIGTPSGSTRDVVVFQAGSGMVWDSSGAANPDKTSYCAFTPSATYGVGAITRVNGTQAQPVSWSSISAGGALPAGKCFHALNSTYGGDLVATWLNMTNMGGTANNVAWPLTGAATFSWQDGVCDNCGAIVDVSASNGSATSTHLLRRIRFRNTPASHGGVNYSANFATAMTTGTRTFEDNVFDGMFGKVVSPGLPLMLNVTYRNNYNGRDIKTSGTSTWAEFKNVLIMGQDVDASGGTIFAGNASDVYGYHTPGGNMRIFSASSTSTGEVTFDRFTCQVALEVNATDGDCWISSGVPTAFRTLTNFLAVPSQRSGGPWNPGTIGTGGVASIAQWQIRNMTEFGGEGPTANGIASAGSGNFSVTLSEAAAGAAGRLAEFKGVLHWDINRPAARNSNHLMSGNTGVVLNTATAANIDYNACVIIDLAGNLCPVSTRFGTHDADGAPPWVPTGSGTALTNYGTPYEVPMSGTVPGPNDRNGIHPRFTDDTRNLEKWVSLFHGKPGTIAGIRAFFDEVPITEVGAAIAHLQWWIRQGFAPRELRYSVAGAPNGRIGAIPIQPGSGSMMIQ